MCYSLPAHALRVIADTESKQTAPELSPQGPRGNGPIVLHTVCGWDKMEWYYAAWLPWWYFWAWLSACCHWPRPQQMPHEIRGHCVLMCGVHVSVPTHISLASLAPCPKSRRAASLQTPHAPTHSVRTPTCSEHTLRRTYQRLCMAESKANSRLCIHAWPGWYECIVVRLVLYILVFNSWVDTVNQSN